MEKYSNNEKMYFLMFPGFDALEKNNYRKKAFSLELVHKQIMATQKLIDNFKIKNIYLKEFMEGEVVDNRLYVKHMLLATLATQVGLFKHYLTNGNKIDYLLGMSLGDVARNTCSGALSFENAVLGILKFSHHLMFMNQGVSALIILPKDINICRDEELLKLKKYQLEVSVYQTSFQALIVGEKENIKNWQEEIANELQIEVKNAYPYPLHSCLMDKVSFSFGKDINQSSYGKPAIPIYSTIFVRSIDRTIDLINENIQNINSSVKFCQTIDCISLKYPNAYMVNMGPSPLLNRFIERMRLENKIDHSSYFEDALESNRFIENFY